VIAGHSPNLFLTILHRRATIFSFTAVGLALGLLLSLILPPKFESTAELMPPNQTGGSLLSAALSAHAGEVPESALSLLGVKTSGTLYIGILQSQSALDDVIAKFDLQRRYRKRTMEATRKRLQSLSDFFEDRKSGIITISVRDPNREQAREMCQEYIYVLNRLISEDTTSTARNEREFLEQRVALAKSDLAQAELQFSQFAAKNKTIDLPEQTKATVGAAATLNGQLVAAEAELNGLRQLYAGQNSRVLAVEGQVATLRNQLAQLTGTPERGNTEDGEQFMGPSLERLPSIGVGYEDLYRNLMMQEALYSTLTTQYELARIEEAKEIPTVRVLDQPGLPEKRVAPSIPLMLIGITCLMFFLGCAWVIASALWDALDPADPKKHIAMVLSQEARNDWLKLKAMFKASNTKKMA
jgi:uncharacterized protein involved in exopolysaccharide biosynthesis